MDPSEPTNNEQLMAGLEALLALASMAAGYRHHLQAAGFTPHIAERIAANALITLQTHVLQGHPHP